MTGSKVERKPRPAYPSRARALQAAAQPLAPDRPAGPPGAASVSPD
jgi:hypothetical protein